MEERKQKLIQIGTSLCFFVTALFLPSDFAKALCFTVSFLISGFDVLWRAASNLFHGKVFDEHFLMSIAGIGSLLIGEFPEGAVVMLLYQVGEFFQDMALDKSRDSITDLMDVRPDFADLVTKDGVKRVSPEEVNVGDTVLVKPGSKIPLDGIVTEGTSTLDTSGLTGESVPREAAPGDTVLSGFLNLGGVLWVRVLKSYGESTVAGILELVENEQSKKSTAEAFITKFAKVYTPIVVFLALILAFLPPLLFPGTSLTTWVYRALVFLVMSCPCALVISVPLSFFGGIGALSRSGILVKGSGMIEALAKLRTVAFDKTGTLTKGEFTVQEIHAVGCSKDELLALSAYAEWGSSHPIALSVKAAYGKEIDQGHITHSKELPGKGVSAMLDEKPLFAGNAKLMRELGHTPKEPNEAGTLLHVAYDKSYLGALVIRDTIKPDALKGIEALREAGVDKTALLTGDTRQNAEAVGKALGIDEIYSELLPVEKAETLDRLLKAQKGVSAFVGDGINDAPVLKHAPLGIAMGALGSDAAIAASDVVIMTDEIGKIATAIRLSRRTLNIASQNIVFAIGVKVLVLMLGALGLLGMWAAVFADVGVALLAILNALRALRTHQTF